MTDFKELLLEHLKKHPDLEIEDAFKFIYQAAFGCEHMAPDINTAAKKIEDEYSSADACDEPFIETLSDGYARVHLSYISKGLSFSTLGKLFCLSAKKEENGASAVDKMLDMTSELILKRLLPFAHSEFTKKAGEWKEKGYCSLHHSDSFRSLYSPKYRVISTEYLPFLPLFAKIDALLSKGKLTLAIDGGSGSGKTTLASLLAKIYDATVFHMDDFFLTPDMRTEQRLSEVGGNVDRERFLSQVLVPLSENQHVMYIPFDCSIGDFTEGRVIAPKNLVIVEGAYSMHPELSKHYGLSVFLNIDVQKQRERILKRNSPMLASRFFNEWIPYETRYFEKTDIKSRCDLVIDI